MSAVTVYVTAEHIAQGERGACSSCPVALALNDAFPGASAWVPGACFELWYDAGGTSKVGNLPEGVNDWIHAFDDGYPADPFSFTVDLPTEVTE